MVKRKATAKQLRALAKGRAKLKAINKKKPHKKIRSKCKKCGRLHSRSAHASHGVGSYARTH